MPTWNGGRLIPHPGGLFKGLQVCLAKRAHFRTIGRAKTQEEEPAVSDEISKCDVILRAMVAMAGADGHLDSREVSLIQEIYEDCTGKALAADAVARAAQENTEAEFRDSLVAITPSLDHITKDEILCAAYRVLLADNRVAGEERKELHDMAKALKVSEIHLSALLEELAATLHQ